MPFTSGQWSEPSSDLSAEDYCRVCLIDENASGEEKTKARCKLPVRSRPGAAYNLNAMAAAAAALAGARGGVSASATAKRKAAGRLLRLYREADREPPESLVRMARG